jgi:hypothetical protein
MITGSNVTYEMVVEYGEGNQNINKTTDLQFFVLKRVVMAFMNQYTKLI